MSESCWRVAWKGSGEKTGTGVEAAVAGVGAAPGEGIYMCVWTRAWSASGTVVEAKVAYCGDVALEMAARSSTSLTEEPPGWAGPRRFDVVTQRIRRAFIVNFTPNSRTPARGADRTKMNSAAKFQRARARRPNNAAGGRAAVSGSSPERAAGS